MRFSNERIVSKGVGGRMIARLATAWLAAVLLTAGLCAQPQPATRNRVVLVITADAGDYILAAGGTIAAMVEDGATAYLIRTTNDEKDSWELSPEETARRYSEQSEQAARILGIKEVISLGYRAGELAAVSHTELRDRLMFYIRLYKPAALFFPNPYAEYVEVLDRFYTGKAAEEAQRVAALENVQPPFSTVGLATHVVGELYYYAQPFDPRRREPESTPAFVPQPKIVGISKVFDKKLRAAQALYTANYSMAMRIRERLDNTGRRLPLLDTVNRDAVNHLVEINLRKLAQIASHDTSYELAEEFHYAGVEYQIPSSYLK
jgi:LmbE family N-acetylglucosaminyl deacetylase